MIPVTYAFFQYNVTYTSTGKTIANYSFEYCSSIKNIPPLANILLELIKSYSHDLFHECPYPPTKRMGVENFPVDSLSVFLSAFNHQRGDYKTIAQVNDKNRKLIFYAIFHTNVSAKRQKKAKSG